MKTALVTTEKRKQIVLTPETELERQVLKMFAEKVVEAKIKTGEFYPCQGGYHRYGDQQSEGSLFIVFDEAEPKRGGEV